MVDHSQRQYFCSVFQAFSTVAVIICALHSVVMMMALIIAPTYHSDVSWRGSSFCFRDVVFEIAKTPVHHQIRAGLGWLCCSRALPLPYLCVPLGSAHPITHRVSLCDTPTHPGPGDFCVTARNIATQWTAIPASPWFLAPKPPASGSQCRPQDASRHRAGACLCNALRFSVLPKHSGR